MSDRTLLMDSPVGPLRLTTDGLSLSAVLFADGLFEPASMSSAPAPVLVEARRQLDAYFTGRRRDFDLPLAPPGTAFQRRVWAQLCRIPFGTTASYGDVAARLDLPSGASRAVGLANGANPIAIIVPCHRVIGSDGTLVGYAGGLQRKRYLLALESPAVQDALFGE